MQAFRSFLQEHLEGEGSTLPSLEPLPEAVNLHDPEVRESANFSLSDITDSPAAIDPVIVYESVRRSLLELGYSIPNATEHLALFSEMEPDGDVVLVLCPGYYLYFAFCKIDEGGYDILAEVVNEQELESILYDEATDAPTPYNS